MAVRTITTKMALDGETEFKRGMTEINAALRASKSELALLEAQFKNETTSIEALTKKDAVLRTELDAQTQKVKLLEEQVKKAAAAYGENGTLTSKYKTQLNQAKVEVIETTQAIKENGEALQSVQDSAEDTRESLEEMSDSTQSTTDAVETMAAALKAAGVAMALREISGVLQECVDSSKAFESAMAGVQKPTKMSDTDLNALGEEIKQLSTQIPATTSEIAAVAEAAARLGVAQEDLLSFTRVMLDLGESSDLSADRAATALARFANIAGTASSDYERLGSVIVALGNNFATSESEITEMASRLASAGTLAGLTEAEIMALAAAMSSVGIQAEAGGTAMTQTLTAIEKAVTSGGDSLEQFARIAGMSAEQFAATWQTNAMGAIQAFIAGLGQLDEQGESATQVLTDLGLSGVRQSNMLKSLALAADTLTGTVNTANQAWAENTELAQTAAARYATTGSQVAMLENAANNLKIAVGDHLTPTLNLLGAAGRTAFSWAAEVVEQSPELVAALGGAVTAVGALSVASAAMAVKVALGTAAVKAFAAALFTTPLGPTILVAGLLGAAFVNAADQAQTAGEAVTDLSESLEKNRAAWQEQTAALAGQKQETMDLVSALETLAGKENKTAAEKETLLSLVEQLNGRVPELALSYDALSDSLNLTTGRIRELALAQAAEEERTATVSRLSQAYIEQQAVAEQLTQAQERLNEAERAYSKAIEERWDADLGMIESLQNVKDEISRAEKALASLQQAQAANAAEIRTLEQAYGELSQTMEQAAQSTEETSRQVQAAMDWQSMSLEELKQAAREMDQTWSELTGTQEEQTLSLEDLRTATTALAGAEDTLTAAMEEQAQAGTLSVKTALSLIDAGYASALAIDTETGAVRLDQEAYAALTIAKLDNQLASLEEQRQTLASAAAVSQHAQSMNFLAGSYLAVDMARRAADNAEDLAAVEAQIAALNRLKDSLTSYSYTATAAAATSKAASSSIKTQAERDLADYKALKAELDHNKAMDLVDEAAYYEQLGQYRDRYLTDDANLDEYYKVTEEIYKYDKSLADKEAALWAEQSQALLSELEDRVKGVTQARDKMADTLAGYGSLYSTGDDGMALESLEEQIEAINRYEQALTGLRDRGISSSLMDQVLGMDVDSATQYANQLLQLSEEQWQEYNDLWEEKQLRAAQVAEQFFKDQLEALETEYTEKLGAALEELTGTSFASGVDTAQGLIDGLASMEGELYAQAQEMAQQVASIFSSAMRVPTYGELAASLDTSRISEPAGVTAQDMRKVGAAVVNGVQTAADRPVQVQVTSVMRVDGKEFYRETLDDFRDVNRANPETMDDI